MILPNLDALQKFAVGRLRLTFGKQAGAYFEEYTELSNPLEICTIPTNGTAGIGKHKTYPYRKNLALLAQGRALGGDEVLLLDPHGLVGEGAISNYAFLVDGHWLTPQEDAGVLPGIVRALAIDHKVIAESCLTVDQVWTAKSVVALSSMKISQPVGRIDDHYFEVGKEVLELDSFLRKICGSNSVG